MTRVTLTGGPELEAALRELGGKVAGRLGTNAVRAGARVIVNVAKQKAPVETGALKKSLRMFDERFKSGGVRAAYAGTRLFYATFVEFGTAHVPARSFLRAAADEAGNTARGRLAENLAAGIKRETEKYRGR